MAAKVMHIGESGSGNKIKLLNQMMFSAINAMTAEMMAVAEKDLPGVALMCCWASHRRRRRLDRPLSPPQVLCVSPTLRANPL